MIIKSSKSGGFEIETDGWRIGFLRVPGWFEVFAPGGGEETVWTDLRPAAVAARERENVECRQRESVA